MAGRDEEKLPLIKMAGKQKKGRREISTGFKIFLTTWAFVENGLFSGLRAGWSALVYVLKQEHIYGDLCYTPGGGNGSTWPTTVTVSSFTDDANGTSPAPYTAFPQTSTAPPSGCDEQDAVFNQCFTVASATMALSGLLYGHLNYKYGIRMPRVISVVIFVGGACCFAFVDKELPWLIYPGLLLVSSGGMALYITNNQISYMFTTGSAAVVGLLCGALEASAIVQSIIKIAYSYGVSMFISYLTLGGLYTLTLISTFCFLPKDYVVSEVITKSPENEVQPEDVEAANDQENKAIVEDYKSAKRVELGNFAGNSCDILADSGIFQDLVTTEKSTDNEDALSIDESQNIANTQRTREGQIGYTRSSVTYPAVTESLEENGNVYKDDESFNIERDHYRIQHESLHTDLQLPVQDTNDRNKIISQISPPELNGKSVDERINDISQSTVVATSGALPQLTLLKCILTKTFMLYLFWAAAVQIILSLSLGTFNPWLEFVTNNNIAQVSEFTDIMLYSMLGSPVLALCFGLAMDALKRVGANSGTPPVVRTLRTATVSLGATSLLGVLLCGLFMTCRDDAVVGTSIILVLFRTGLYSCGTAFLRIMYPTNYFGILCGIMTVLSGGISYVQYPLFLWIQGRDQAWTEVFGFMGIIGLVSLVQPVYLHWKSRMFSRNMLKRKGELSNGLNAGSPTINETE